MLKAVGNEPSEAQYKTASALPEADRFQFLPTLAERAYIRGEGLEHSVGLAAAKEDWELARKYARDALRVAAAFVRDPNYGNAVYKANMTLGMVAMRVDGDVRAATKYLLAAS